MAAPFLHITSAGAITSSALADQSEGELREILQATARLVRESSAVPEIVQAEISRSVQAIETWLRLLKSGLDEFSMQRQRIDNERQRLSREVLELRRWEGCDPTARQLRLRVEDSLHKVGQDELKLIENWRKEQLAAKEAVLELHGELVKHMGRLSQLGIPHGPLSSAQDLFGFLDHSAPREVLIINPPLVVETILPPRLP
jgi:hypothetical protein